jgi:hypothetical protein
LDRKVQGLPIIKKWTSSSEIRIRAVYVSIIIYDREEVIYYGVFEQKYNFYFQEQLAAVCITTAAVGSNSGRTGLQDHVRRLIW